MRDADFDEVVNTLLAKTAQGRIGWEEGNEREAFTCSLGTFVLALRRIENDDRTVVQLSIKEESGHLLWEIRARSEVASVRPAAQANLFRRLSDLLDLARNQALSLDAKLTLLRDTLAHA